ncbi:MAG: calcineurin-like phosphoesterase C-terminal domain-containing protein [Pseudomonadota bacterium]
MRTLILSLCLLLACLPGQVRASDCVPVQVDAASVRVRAKATANAAVCIEVVRAPRLRAPRSALQVLVFGDPQVQLKKDVEYYQRDIIEPLLGDHGAALGLTLGDLVDDEPSLYPDVKAATERLGIPWLYAPGNHDIDPGAVDDASALQGFHRAIGPDTHARETAQATFVVLDDVITLPGRRPSYIGGFREDQFAFLEAYLPTVPKDRLLVLAVHIPLFELEGGDTFRDADRERLFRLLQAFPHVLVLSAHSHAQRHVFHDVRSGWNGAAPLHEYNVGATCGSYWSGAKDAAGIPDSSMNDGTPNGYATLTVQPGGTYALRWHVARDPEDRQIGLHAPKVLRRGAYPAWGVFANVYMGMDDTRVEYRVDGAQWRPMVKVLQPDPALTTENARDDLADKLRGFDRSPEAQPSPHLWRGALPTTLAAGEHVIEVRAFDRWRGEVTATTRYRLEDAEP